MDRTTIDQFFKNEGGSAGSRDGHGVLDRSMPRDPASEPPSPHYWDVFRDKCRAKQASQGTQFFTFTVHSKLMYKKQYVFKMDPLKQSKAFKQIVRDVMTKVCETVDVSYYIFFEYGRNGLLHCHGIAYPVSDEVIFAYPWYSAHIKSCAKKCGFNMRGTDVQPVKYIEDCFKYISKDAGKHPIQPLHS